MVSLILTVVMPKLVKSYVGTLAAVTMMVGLEPDKCNHFPAGIRRSKHGAFHACDYPVSTQHFVDQRLDQHRNSLWNGLVLTIRDFKSRIQNLHSGIISLRSVSSSWQRCSSSVLLPVSSVRESNLPTLGTNRCIVC
jgi:hypothetical protein